MAITYSNFKVFPIVIFDITAEYNAIISQVEAFVKSDMKYILSEEDESAVLPYFVFWFLCQDASSTVSIKAGESEQVKEFTIPSIAKQIQVWNLGCENLRALLEITPSVLNSMYGVFDSEKIHTLMQGAGITINEKYLSKRSFL